jgi:hypothetical protein
MQGDGKMLESYADEPQKVKHRDRHERLGEKYGWQNLHCVESS